MMAFRIWFCLTCLVVLFSCEERIEKKIPSSDIVQRRLFEIKSIEQKKHINNLLYYEQPNIPLFEITLKNVSGFDLDLHYDKGYYHKGDPLWAASCIEYSNYPTTAECMFFADTSCLIKKNEEFIVYVDLWMPDSQFYKNDSQGVKFRILISSSNDLSFYFEDNPTKPTYKILGLNNGKKEYAYPFEFTYLVSNGIFFEQHLLE
jgi:hypothetical protein